MSAYSISSEGSGSLRWHVLQNGVFIRRFQTRKLAALFVRLCEGDRSVAAAFHRASLKQAERCMARRDALRYAAHCVQEFGLSPSDCATDGSGEPLQEASHA